ncbi:MAG: hypothetical protein IJX89_02710 [Alphaproteobacteria bacterium]|nr:hypothetical protein [Alphaproteobacteria bacterium]
MHIKLHHLSAEEAWNDILRFRERYHSRLKHFNYKYHTFVPKDKRIHDFIEKEKPTLEQIQYYHDVFVNDIYNMSDLSRFDSIITNDVLPNFQRAVEKQIVPLLSTWNATIPKSLTIECMYGNGGSYGYGTNPRIVWRMSEFNGNKYEILNSFLHEFVHILIEIPIIIQYNVPQDLKECIVDIICLELFGRKPQNKFDKSFANLYITPTAIKTDLAGAVKKMMTDYTAIKQRQNQERN